jgi:hypothetical protein
VLIIIIIIYITFFEPNDTLDCEMYSHLLVRITDIADAEALASGPSFTKLVVNRIVYRNCRWALPVYHLYVFEIHLKFKSFEKFIKNKKYIW